MWSIALMLIKEDEELSDILYQAFKWEGRPYLVAEKITKLRTRLWEKYKMDFEIYT